MHHRRLASLLTYVSIVLATVVACGRPPLPGSLAVDGEFRRSREYNSDELTWLTYADGRDTEERLRANLELLAQADYLVLASNRIYGVIPRLPERYPLSSQFHQLLFNGELGYEPVFVTGRAPSLAGVQLRADRFRWPGLTPPVAVTDYLAAAPGINWGRADESFTVYDQPLPVIFRNEAGLSVDEMLATFTLNK